MDPVGYIAEYIEKNRLVLAMVQTNKKGRLGVLTSGDRQAALPQNRALLFTPAAIGPDRPRDALVAYLRELEERREDMAAQVDVPELWELVHEEDDPLPLPDLAELCFGKPVEDDHLSAILRALFNERLHFRLAGKDFLPLGAEQLEQKVLTQEKEAEHRAEVDAAVAYLKAPAPQGRVRRFAPPRPRGSPSYSRIWWCWKRRRPRPKRPRRSSRCQRSAAAGRSLSFWSAWACCSPTKTCPCSRNP